MNRRLMFRCALGCAAVCLAGWRLPGLLDRTLSSVDEHRGTLSLLTGSGLTIEAGAPRSPQQAAKDAETLVLGAADSLTPAQRARLIEAARRHSPLAEAEAKIAALKGKKANAAQAPKPAPAQQAPPTMDATLANALKALGMDPESMDFSSVDVEALLAKAREVDPKRD